MTGLVPWEKWQEYLLSEFKLQLSADSIEYFKVYLEELVHWNDKINLVSIRSQDEVLWRHFADSLAGIVPLNDYIRNIVPGQKLSVADIGTGAGFPGIPLKIANPEIQLTLIESITKKCSFLEEIRQKLSIPGIKILNGRAEDIGQLPEERAKYDVVLSRAVSKLSPNLETAIPLLKIGGVCLIYKTSRFAEDINETAAAKNALNILKSELTSKHYYNTPGQPEKYCIMIFKKKAATPAKYPRRAGVPKKTPL